MGTRASQFVALKDETSSFETKMDIERTRKEQKMAISCLRHLRFGEKKMRFGRGEVVFYSLKTRSKTANVKVEKVDGGAAKTLMVG